MGGMLEDIIESTFRIKENEGEDKVVSLEEAIRRNVKPGMALHFHFEPDPTAAICEIIRQYWGKRPEFTMIIVVVSGHTINLIHNGLVKKVITSNCSNLFPAPGPSRVIQRAYKEKRIEIESWSLYTHMQMLMAGALGTGFLPTKSIIGSSMAEENKESFQVIDDPFGSGRRIGLVKALNPDVSFIHGWAADRYGNTIMSPAVTEGLWGAKASTKGVVVTVEKIVSTDFIREHSPFVKLPGYMVSSVSVVPFGAHPCGLGNIGLKEFDAYGEDYDFMTEHQKASENPDTLDAWIKEWVLDCPNHEDYLRKLGYEKLLFLKGKAIKGVWEQELESLLESISTSEEYNPTEMMVVAAARKIRERVLRNRYRIIHTGVGTAALAAWMAYHQLRKEGYDVDMVHGGGACGYSPRPADPFLNISNTATSKMLSDTFEAYGVIVGGETNNCISALGTAQIDKYGNINTLKLSEEQYMIGAGGANDAASGAREVVVVTTQSRGRFLEKVPYISCPGDRVRTLVSSLGVFEKIGDDPEFTLTQYFPDAKLKTAEENIGRVRENCGWELKVSPQIEEAPRATLEELLILRLLDAKKNFIG